MDQFTRIYEKNSVINTFNQNLGKQYLGHLAGSLGWEDHYYYWYSLTFLSSFYLFIDLSIYYLLIYFSLLLIWPFIVTFILLFYHFLYLLSQFVLYYLLCIHFIISLCS